jgi:chromosome segregation ATPase
MNQETLRLASMQATRRQWDSVHSSWQADVERWQREHQSALAELEKLQAMIREHGKALEAHAQTVESHYQALREYGQAMAEYERQGSAAQIAETIAAKHRELGRQHHAQQDAHERIEKHHQTVMTRLANVEAALEAAM